MEQSNLSLSDGMCCNLFNFKKGDLIKSGFYRTKCLKNLVFCGCGWESGDRKLSINHINFVHKLSNPDCEISKRFTWDLKNYSEYKSRVNEIESVMKETFFAYPKAYPDIEKMVKAGFYYTGIDDATACISCGLMLDQWNPDEDPIEEHRRASPFCNLI